MKFNLNVTTWTKFLVDNVVVWIGERVRWNIDELVAERAPYTSVLYCP